MKTVRRPPYPKWNPGYFPCSSLTPLPLSSRRPSVSFGGFGLREPLVLAGGFVSRRDGTMNIMLTHAKPLPGAPPVVPQSHSWR